MSFVIYNKNTFDLWYGGDYGPKHYDTERVAKASRTKAKLNAVDWAVIDYNAFCDIEPIVTVEALMTGKPVQLRKRDVGNRALDPSMEGYYTL